MAKGQSGRPKIVPESHAAIDQMKYEIAAELGLQIEYPLGDTSSEFAGELGIPVQSKEGYWGNVSSRDAGHVGGTITARLVRQAEQQLMNLE